MFQINTKGACFAVILVSAFNSGCVTPAVYDESWAEQVKVESGACPDIDGEYQNAGEQFYKDKNDNYQRVAVSLANRLNTWGDDSQDYDDTSHQADSRLGTTFSDPAQDAYQTVRLRFVDGLLHIEASLPDGSTKTFDLQTRDRCRDSTLLLKASWVGSETFGLLMSVVDRETLALGRAQDGSLLLREGGAGGLFVLEWPLLVGGGAGWIRFAPVEPARAPAPEQLSGLTPWQEGK